MAQRVAAVDAAIADPDAARGKISAGERATATSRRRSTRAIRRSRCARFLETLLARPGAAEGPQAHGTAAPIKRKPRPAAAARTPAAHLCARPVGGQAPRFRLRQRGHAVGAVGRQAGDGRAACSPVRSANISRSSTSIRRRTASTIRSISTTRCCLRRTACRRPKAIRSSTSRWSMPSRMTTIGHFERALGRRALWAPHYGEYKAPTAT